MFRTSVGGVDILRIPLRGPTGPSSEISCFTWEDAPENLRSRIHMDSPNLQFKHAETIAWICLDPVSWSPAHSCPAADCYIFLWVSSTFHPMRMIFLRRSFVESFQAFQAFITAEHLCEDEVSMKAWKISMTGFLSQSFQASMVSLWRWSLCSWCEHPSIHPHVSNDALRTPWDPWDRPAQHPESFGQSVVFCWIVRIQAKHQRIPAFRVSIYKNRSLFILDSSAHQKRALEIHWSTDHMESSTEDPIYISLQHLAMQSAVLGQWLAADGRCCNTTGWLGIQCTHEWNGMMW